MSPNHFIPVVATVLSIVSPLSAQQPAGDFSWVDPAIPKADAEGWITLFDGEKLHGCSLEQIRAKVEKVGVSSGCLWLESGGVEFDISARNLALRAVVKKISGQNVALGWRKEGGKGFNVSFDGTNGFGIGIFRPQWGSLTSSKVSQNFPDFLRMEVVAQESLITIKADDKLVASAEDATINQAGGVSIYALKGRSLFRKIEVKILDGPPPPLSWTNVSGVPIQGDFVRLDKETVVIRKDGKEFKLPLSKLSLASRKQAVECAGAQAPPSDPP